MPNILDGSGGNALSLLSAARTSYPGIGLSANARQLNDDYLSQSQAALNSILSLGVSGNGSIQAIQQKILAIRASLPRSHISQEILDAEAKNADTGVSPDSKGQTVDTEA